jgi:hypothetical protein
VYVVALQRADPLFRESDLLWKSLKTERSSQDTNRAVEPAAAAAVVVVVVIDNISVVL